MKSSSTVSRTESKTGEEIDLNDIRQMIHADHGIVSELFFQFTQTDDKKIKGEIVKKILKELYVHLTAEEGIVYPAIRKEADDVEDLMDEADTEHHVVKLLMTELSEMKPSDDHFDSKVKVLCELVTHHVKEEEKEMFHKIEESDIDVDALGKKFAARKTTLLAEAMPKLSLPFKTNSRLVAPKKK
jgi:hemerythrin superfamily protein